MNSQERQEIERLSAEFQSKIDAVDKQLKDDPDLGAEGAYEKYWELQNAAASAAVEWQQYCSSIKP